MNQKERTRLTIDIDDAMHRKLKALSASMGLTMRQTLIMLIESFIQTMDKEKEQDDR